MSSQSPNTVRLRYYAKVMLKHPTGSEYALWQYLKARRLLGVTFRRQRIIGQRIVDFLAPKLKVVVEVQGGYHEHTELRDRRRAVALNRCGYTVVYVTAAEVLEQPAVAVERIRQAVVSQLG